MSPRTQLAPLWDVTSRRPLVGAKRYVLERNGSLGRAPDLAGLSEAGKTAAINAFLAGETLVPYYSAETGGSSSSSYPLLSGTEGDNDKWFPIGSYDHYAPADTVNPIERWEAVGGVDAIVNRPSVTLYPEDFGAVGDGVTNDTAAWQACIDAAIAIGMSSTDAAHVRIVMRPVTYLISSAPRTDRHGYSILSLCQPSGASLGEVNPDSNVPSITIEGAPGVGISWTDTRSVLKTTRNDTYSGTFGQPSIIGAATGENGADGFLYFGCLTVRNVRLLMDPDCRLSGIDALSIGGLETDGLDIYSDVDPVNTNVASVGIRTPGLWGTWHIRIKDTTVHGPYAALALAKIDHMVVDRFYPTGCVIAVAFDDDTFGAGHLASRFHATVSGCKYILAGWSQSTGAKSLTGTFPNDSPHIQDWTISFEQGSAPYDHVYTVMDANNLMYGTILFSRYAAGLQYGNPGTYLGAANLDFKLMAAGRLATRRNVVPTNAEIQTGEAQIWFDSTAGAAKLMVKAKNASGTVVTGSINLT